VPTERVQRQIDRLLDEAEAALGVSDWEVVRVRAEAVLRLDSANEDARTYLDAANKDEPQHSKPLGDGKTATTDGPGRQPVAMPTSFANGRYVVKRFLGEGGKKKVYLCHDARLDRDVAFSLIKTEGLDDVGVARIRQEAQAMGRLGGHANIVTIHDIGEEGGQLSLVSELMGGGDVEGLIERPITINSPSIVPLALRPRSVMLSNMPTRLASFTATSSPAMSGSQARASPS